MQTIHGNSLPVSWQPLGQRRSWLRQRHCAFPSLRDAGINIYCSGVLIHVSESLAWHKVNRVSSHPDDSGITEKQAGEVSVQTCMKRARNCIVSPGEELKSRTMFSDLRAPCKTIYGAGSTPKWMLSSAMLGIFLRAVTGLWLWEIPDSTGFSDEKCHRVQHAPWQNGEKEKQRQGDAVCHLDITHLTLCNPVYRAFPYDVNPMLYRNQSCAQKC